MEIKKLRTEFLLSDEHNRIVVTTFPDGKHEIFRAEVNDPKFVDKMKDDIIPYLEYK
jgi:hypothetical protein